MPKALALHSGGLDSTLAIRVIQEQGVPVEVLHFVSIFDCGATEEDSCAKSIRMAGQLGLTVRCESFSDDLLAIVRNPKHGYGSNMNPCIDCHARMLQRAAGMMRELGADFLITGEVLGERPMSQRREALKIVEREAGIEGLLLRPLSAKLLDPTIPEQKGWVDREKLLGISGRCRKPQFDLARKFGITKYPTPAGGCLLTDPGFAARVRDLLTNQPEAGVDDVRLLKVGRHFRLGPTVKAVVGRNHEENQLLEKFCLPTDLFLEAAEHPGPLTLIRGTEDEETLRTVGAITLRYGKAQALPQAKVRIWKASQPLSAARLMDASSAPEELLDRLRVGEGGGGRRGE